MPQLVKVIEKHLPNPRGLTVIPVLTKETTEHQFHNDATPGGYTPFIRYSVTCTGQHVTTRHTFNPLLASATPTAG